MTPFGSISLNMHMGCHQISSIRIYGFRSCDHIITPNLLQAPFSRVQLSKHHVCGAVEKIFPKLIYLERNIGHSLVISQSNSFWFEILRECRVRVNMADTSLDVVSRSGEKRIILENGFVVLSLNQDFIAYYMGCFESLCYCALTKLMPIFINLLYE